MSIQHTMLHKYRYSFCYKFCNNYHILIYDMHEILFSNLICLDRLLDAYILKHVFSNKEEETLQLTGKRNISEYCKTLMFLICFTYFIF